MNTRAKVLSIAPLALALGALCVREATREKTVAARQTSASHEFVVPELFLAAARAPAVEQTLRVDASSSRALVSSSTDGDARVERTYVPSGTVHVAAEDGTVELELGFATTPASDSDALTLHTVGSRSQATEAPGTKTATLRAHVATLGHTHEGNLEVAWLRLPGGRMRLQGVIDLDDASATKWGPWWDDQGARERLAFDLTLAPQATER